MSEIMKRIEWRENEFGELKQIQILQLGDIASLPKSNDQFYPGERAFFENEMLVPFHHIDGGVYNVPTVELKRQFQILEYAKRDDEFATCRYLSTYPIEIELPTPEYKAPQYTTIKISLLKRFKNWLKHLNSNRKRKKQKRKKETEMERIKRITGHATAPPWHLVPYDSNDLPKYIADLDKQFQDWNSKEKKN